MVRKSIACIMLLITVLMIGCNKVPAKETSKPDLDEKKAEYIALQLETDHFKLYSLEQDKECLEDMSKTLEENYIRITENLNTSLTKKVIVNVYSDLKSFHVAIGQPDAPDWVVGNANPKTKIIQVVNPTNAGKRSYEEIMQVVVHEFTHIVTLTINDDMAHLPLWLLDGIAAYEANQTQAVDKALAVAKEKNEYPTLESLEMDPYKFGSSGGYQYSYSIMKYMIETYGYDKVVELIKHPSDIEKVLGLSEEEFQKAWIAQLK